MVIEVQYDELIHQERVLESRIEMELKKPTPDAQVLRRLRWRKLLIKDQLESWDCLMRLVLPAQAASAMGTSQSASGIA